MGSEMCIRDRSSLSPPTITVSVPFSAPACPPDTGASKKPNPLSTPEKQEHLKKLSVGHTSMSVGDFVVFGETKERIYVVDSMGFKKVEPTNAWFESLYFPTKPGES